MLNLLNFFEGEGSTGGGMPAWVMYVVLGVLVVGMILLMIIPQRKQKKKAAEMMSKLAIGSIITTIGGIVGEVIQMDEQHIWIETGTGDNKSTMQFLRQAIHSIAPAPGSPEAIAQEKAAEEAKNEEDEIK